MMSDWNVLATAQPRQLQRLFSILESHGEFQHAPFRGVIIGPVAEPEALFETLMDREARKGRTLSAIGHMVPIDRVFAVAAEALEARLREAVAPYADRIGGGRFHVRVERRGLKGVVHSQEIERALDAHLLALVEAQGTAAQVDFADPDAVVAVETLGTVCGVGLVTRALHERFPFVRVD